MRHRCKPDWRAMIHAIHEGERDSIGRRCNVTSSCRESEIWNHRDRDVTPFHRRLESGIGVYEMTSSMEYRIKHISAWTRTPKHDVKSGIM